MLTSHENPILAEIRLDKYAPAGEGKWAWELAYIEDWLANKPDLYLNVYGTSEARHAYEVIRRMAALEKERGQ